MPSRVPITKLLAVAALLAAAAACESPPRVFGEDDLARGRTLYDTNGCAACHGADGYGNGQLASTLRPPPRDFRRADAFKGLRTPEAVAATIAQGIFAVPTPMPAYAHIPEDERQLIAAYVLSIGGFVGAGTPP